MSELDWSPMGQLNQKTSLACSNPIVLDGENGRRIGQEAPNTDQRRQCFRLHGALGGLLQENFQYLKYDATCPSR